MMDIKLKETSRIMFHQVGNINKNTEIIKRNQTGILELRSTKTGMRL